MTETIEYLTCQNCGWQGEPGELVSLTDALDDRKYAHCPDCEGASFEHDTEEVEI